MSPQIRKHCPYPSRVQSLISAKQLCECRQRGSESNITCGMLGLLFVLQGLSCFLVGQKKQFGQKKQSWYVPLCERICDLDFGSSGLYCSVIIVIKCNLADYDIPCAISLSKIAIRLKMYGCFSSSHYSADFAILRTSKHVMPKF